MKLRKEVMMKILIDRAWKKDTYTIGKIFIDGVRLCETMEDKDRGLSSDMPLEEIKKRKVYGETAIPTGTYELDLNNYSYKFRNRIWAKRYNGIVPRFKNVKGYDGVLFHPLNTAKDSLGCVGVGKNTIPGAITNSTTWYYKLMDDYLMPARRRGEKVFVTIK